MTVSRETFASDNPSAAMVIRTFAEILCAICTSRPASAMQILKKSPFRLAFSFSRTKNVSRETFASEIPANVMVIREFAENCGGT